jgi:hypothetical protein
MAYYIKYDVKTIVINDGEKEVIRIESRFTFLGKYFFRIYHKGVFILECSYTSSIFSIHLKIIENNVDEVIEFKKMQGKYVMNYEGDFYSVVKNFRGVFVRNPVYKLFKNDTETGEVFYLQKIAIGPGLLYKIDFHEEDKSNLFQLMFFVLRSMNWLLSP